MEIKHATVQDAAKIPAELDANLYQSGQLLRDQAHWHASETEQAKRIFTWLLAHRRLGNKEYSATTMTTARSNEAARKFLRDVYSFAFNGSPEPDLADDQT